MLDETALRLLASGLKARLCGAVKFISEKCYPENIEKHVWGLNKTIRIGVDAGVTKARELEESEIESLIHDLSLIRAMDHPELEGELRKKLAAEARSLLVAALIAKNVDPVIFEEGE